MTKVFLFIIVFSGISYHSESQTDTSLLCDFLDYDSVYYKANAIPKKLFSKVSRTLDLNLDITDDSTKFNSSDVIIPGMSRRLFLFGGMFKKTIGGYIVFKQGGIIVTTHVLFYGNNYRSYLLVTPYEPLNNPNDLKQFVWAIISRRYLH